jgi:serine phosphatase RsbU (regulator of sigma subunit)
MTLAKGFLKALSRTYHSPGETLSLMNNMFYENVNRGNFISMIYGIFDLDKKMLTLARAGHNPLIVKQSSSGEVKFVQPKGIALGLEKGEIFSKSILEEDLTFNSGDTFVFYTDGFTEAMNKNKEEYGEDRLSKTINDNILLSSEDLLKKIYSDVRSFIGKEKQHDDMTIVVVKID